MSTLDPLPGVEDVARRLLCSESRVRELIYSGRLRAVKPGGSWVIKPEWIDAYLDAEPQPKRQAPQAKESLLPDLGRYE